VNLRGLEMLLALTGCMLLFGVFTGNLTFADILWASAGIATVLAITAGVMGTLFPYLKETRRWERFTEKTGRALTLHSRGGVHRPSLSGRVADCHVTISPVDREHMIVVSVPQVEHHEITLALKTELEDGVHASLALGDPSFDEQVVLHGSIPEVVAVLDVQTRQMVLELMQDLSVQVKRRQVIKWGRHLDLDPQGTWLCLERMVNVADRLFRLEPGRAMRNLGVNAERDPHPKVRALNLRLLFEYYPPNQRTLAIGRRALASENVEVVLAGAIGLAEAGDELDKERAFEHLADIARQSFSDDVRSPAIEALSMSFHERSRPVLEELAKTGGPLPSELLFALVRVGIEPELEHLIPRVLMAPERVQSEIARELSAHGTRFERLACAMLDSAFESVQIEIADGLARTGTIRAVEGLLPLTKGLLRSKGLRDRAQHAIESIQSRIIEGDGGQLSLTEPARGELSFGPNQLGALSFREE
jgi:hypothetical protein